MTVTSEYRYDPTKKDKNGGLTQEQSLYLNYLKQHSLYPISSCRADSIVIDIRTLFDIVAEKTETGFHSRTGKPLYGLTVNGVKVDEFIAVANGNAHRNYYKYFRVRKGCEQYIEPMRAGVNKKIPARYCVTGKLIIKSSYLKSIFINKLYYRWKELESALYVLEKNE